MLQAFLTGARKTILPEPQALLTPTSKIIGLDGRKMSKKATATALIFANHRQRSSKRSSGCRRTQARATLPIPATLTIARCGTLHQVYSSDDTKAWVRQGCTTAGIGCLECKQPVIDAVNAELAPMQARIRDWTKPGVRQRGARRRVRACTRGGQKLIAEVRQAMGLAKV